VKVADVASGLNWYAIQTRSRHEKLVARQLEGQGITTFLPLTTKLHRWSDRQKMVQLPLFPGYAFVQIPYVPEQRVRVLRIDGVVSFVGQRGQGIPIPDGQIDGVKALISGNVPFSSHPFLQVGQRVRIRGGALEGVEGLLVSRDGGRNLIISVEPIQRSLSINLDGYNVEPV
jgi:transcription antitermination factor NusG